eukprot:gnl/TRDRNA2_/TRDRNA2_198301_c0_seq1.p1 gnl/TRDRNA2_/TRDRNA2_198301_c0~~gnl/TRDRNA2_/TRDRNA2_198301_c0_seq1.p1  ORF type:complete len:446 (+),score=61.70 gnl/TRDRNA2_/TRDRNA2_198301_c0_seq1:66-1340(+)
MAEQRVDPSDGKAYTFEETSRFYAKQYKKWEIEQYWATTMQPLIVEPAEDIPGLLEIDGSFGEGGGQVLRNTFAYAAVLGRAIRVSKIRNGRPKPGLAAQHLTGITTVSSLACGKLTGAAKGSKDVLFVPGETQASSDSERQLTADCGTAGAVTLVIQSILPVLALGSGGCTTVNCKGGTDVPFSPPIDYFLNVTLPNVARFGVNPQVDVLTRGLMPAGGGSVKISCTPSEQLQPLQLLDFGCIQSAHVKALFCGSGVSKETAQEAVSAAVSSLRDAIPKDVRIEECVEAVGPLSVSPSNFLSISVTVSTSTGCVLAGNAMDSSRTPSVGQLVSDACGALVADIQRGACLDSHCSDQVVIFMALAAGRSMFRTGPLTEHTRTAIHFAQACTGASFQVTSVPGSDGQLFEVQCDGIGWRRQVSSS